MSFTAWRILGTNLRLACHPHPFLSVTSPSEVCAKGEGKRSPRPGWLCECAACPGGEAPRLPHQWRGSPPALSPAPAFWKRNCSEDVS